LGIWWCRRLKTIVGILPVYAGLEVCEEKKLRMMSPAGLGRGVKPSRVRPKRLN